MTGSTDLFPRRRRRPRALQSRAVGIMFLAASLLFFVSRSAFGWFQAPSPAQPSPAQAQAAPELRQDPDRPAPTCAKILLMTSSEWIANVTAIHDSSEDGLLRGVRLYGDCYDARTKRLAVALSKSGRSPSAGARDDFKEFESAIKDFTSKALAMSDPPADKVKTAYAALYEKQFRYEFYESYEPQTPAVGTPARKAAAKNNSPSADSTSAKASAPPDKAGPSDADDMTKAKNRFGELLDALTEENRHSVHEVFGDILGLHPTTSATELAVYRYAIFVLEPFTSQSSLNAKPLAKPFAPPPF
jgi:hypothetical protein